MDDAYLCLPMVIIDIIGYVLRKEHGIATFRPFRKLEQTDKPTNQPSNRPSDQPTIRWAEGFIGIVTLPKTCPKYLAMRSSCYRCDRPK